MRPALAGWLLLVALVPATAQVRSSYWGASQSGWFWYEQRHSEPAAAPVPLVPPAPPEPDAKPAASGLAGEDPALQAHRALQQRLEDERSIAIMVPSFANVERYLRTQGEVMRRAADFADVWQRVVWTTPDLDYTARQRPANAAGLRAWDRRQQGRRGSRLAQAAQTHGLFYVFGQDCLYCQLMAETLARMRSEHGFAVVAIAVDGARDPAFPDAWPDNGFVAAAGVTQLPALLLAQVDERGERIIPVAYGPVGDLELEQRIEVLTSVPVGQRF